MGRFAPSPTGDLHFGSFLAAVASYLDAKNAGGGWLLRIEDLDPPREVAGSAASIIRDLEQLGMTPDGPVMYQSNRSAAYQAACDTLLEQGMAYWCGCSRSDLPSSGVYPGTCRNGLPNGKQARALRIRTDDRPIHFSDYIQGKVNQDLSKDCGDFIIKRADGYFAYQLAVVIDDAEQKITNVVRGADLLDSTTRQIWLQQCLQLPTPKYAHLPLVVQKDGNKLSKSLGADPLRNSDKLGSLQLALKLLGQDPPQTDWKSTWEWAIAHWSMAKIPRINLQMPI